MTFLWTLCIRTYNYISTFVRVPQVEGRGEPEGAGADPLYYSSRIPLSMPLVQSGIILLLNGRTCEIRAECVA